MIVILLVGLLLQYSWSRRRYTQYLDKNSDAARAMNHVDSAPLVRVVHVFKAVSDTKTSKPTTSRPVMLVVTCIHSFDRAVQPLKNSKTTARDTLRINSLSSNERATCKVTALVCLGAWVWRSVVGGNESSGVVNSGGARRKGRGIRAASPVHVHLIPFQNGSISSSFH